MELKHPKACVMNDKNDEEIKEDTNDYYDWEMIPRVYSDDSKTGVTFKGESPEYLEASKKLLL